MPTEHIDPSTLPGLIVAFCTAIAAVWGFSVWMVHQNRKDSRTSQRQCMEENGRLGARLTKVEDDTRGILVKQVGDSTRAIERNTAVLERIEDRLPPPRQRDDITPPANDALERRFRTPH